jgi:hypothetical protein
MFPGSRRVDEAGLPLILPIDETFRDTRTPVDPVAYKVTFAFGVPATWHEAAVHDVRSNVG